MSRVLVLLVVLLTTAFEVVALVLATESPVIRVAYAVYSVVQAIAGALIVWRHPRHVIGWLLALSALLNAITADACLAYGQRAAQEGWPWGEQAELVGLLSWIFGAIALWGLFLLFPDGRLSDRRWLAVPVVWLVGAALAIPGWAFNPRLGSEFESGTNPFARPGFPAEELFVAGAILVCASVVASFVALVLRFRRARGVERQQITWVLLAAGVLVSTLPFAALLWTAWPPIQVITALVFPLVPVAACVALLKYRLYDVELVVSRTVSWAVLTALLAGGYVGVVALAGVVFSSPVSAALAALVVAVAFRPLRARLQNAVDRRFRRTQYEARRAMTDFVERVRRGDASADEVEAALRSAVHDPQLVLEIRPATAVDPGPGRTVSRVGSAVVSHRVEDTALLLSAVDAGRLAIEIASLQGELRRQLTELETSRSRMAAVADDERRRIARDLHDGAQQRLVAIGLGLRHVQHQLGEGGPMDVHQGLNAAVGELTQAIGDLRTLAGGLRPAALELGLEAALRDLAARTPTPIRVNATPERFASDLESAAWFIACEGVTNAVKHARAAELTVEVHRDRDTLVVSVCDDGRGGAVVGSGSGLLGLSDRVRARGGSVTLVSPEGGGTRLEARLPCG